MSSTSTFLQKLLTMIEDPKSDHHIAWSADGTSFFVFDIMMFSREILSQYFRHNKFASFVRQLNMYDFHKIPINRNGMTLSENAVQFTNPNFVRGQPHLLRDMKRKAVTVRVDSIDASGFDAGHLTAAIEALARSDQQLNSKLSDVQTDGQHLRRECAKLWQKSTQQEQTVNKIMTFLTSIYGSDDVSCITQLSTSPTLPDLACSSNSPSTGLLALDSSLSTFSGPVQQPLQQSSWLQVEQLSWF